LPKGATLEGHIHIHWNGSGPANKTFSDNGEAGDDNMWKENPKIFFYLINSDGDLIGRFPDKMDATPDDPHPPSGQIFRITNNYYGKEGERAYVPENSILRGYRNSDLKEINALQNLINQLNIISSGSSSNDAKQPLKAPVFY
jgi:hypothetical protein